MNASHAAQIKMAAFASMYEANDTEYSEMDKKLSFCSHKYLFCNFSSGKIHFFEI